MQLHPVTGQRNISAHCSVYPTCLRSSLPKGETHRRIEHTYLHHAPISINTYLFYISGHNIQFINRRVLWKVHSNQLCGVRGRNARRHTDWGKPQTCMCAKALYIYLYIIYATNSYLLLHLLYLLYDAIIALPYSTYCTPRELKQMRFFPCYCTVYFFFCSLVLFT